MLQIHMFNASNHHVPLLLHRVHPFSMVNSPCSVIFGTQKWPMNPRTSCPPSSSPASAPVAPPRHAPPPPWRRRPDGTTERPLRWRKWCPFWWILSANLGIQICFLFNLFVWEIVVVYQYISVQWGEVWGYLLAILLLLYCIQLVYSMMIYSISDHLRIGWFSWEASNQPTNGKRTSMGGTVPVSLENFNEWTNE